MSTYHHHPSSIHSLIHPCTYPSSIHPFTHSSIHPPSPSIHPPSPSIHSSIHHHHPFTHSLTHPSIRSTRIYVTPSGPTDWADVTLVCILLYSLGTAFLPRSCQGSVISSVLSHHNKNLKRQMLKPSACHSCQTDRVIGLGSWTDRVIALGQISFTPPCYSSVLFRE